MLDEPMLTRLRAALAGLPVREQKMFGGTCFMLAGNMLICTSKRGVLVRVGKDGHAAAVAKPHVRPMKMGAHVMQGYVFVAPEAVRTAKDLKSWIARAQRFVDTLPRKSAETRKTKR